MRDTVAPRKAVCSFFGHYDIYDTNLKQRCSPWRSSTTRWSSSSTDRVVFPTCAS